MSGLSWMQAGGVDIEVAADAWHVVHDGRFRTFPVEKNADGSPTPAAVQRLIVGMRDFVPRRPWQGKSVARCALPANGVTLRRLTFPRATGDALHRLVAMQTETELPLPPEELAWGWIKVGESGGGATQEIVVVAIRKTAVAPMMEVLAACGLEPKFTLSALVRAGLDGFRAGAAAQPGVWLELGVERSELLVMDEKGPQRLRVLSWGERALVTDWMSRFGMTEALAQARLHRWVAEGVVDAEGSMREGIEASVRALAAGVPQPLPAGPVWLSGRLAAVTEFRACFGGTLGREIRLATPGAETATPEGVRRVRAVVESGYSMAVTSPETVNPEVRPVPWKWAALGIVLLFALLAIPYAEAILLRPALVAHMASIRSGQSRLQLIDREADFLRSLKQDQAPYHDTLVVLSKTLPPGSKMDSMSLNRKGELSLRVTMRQPPEVTDFRTKLTETGFFTSVVIEEQSPSPDRQKIQVRLSAQVKPLSARQGLKILAVEDKPKDGRPGGASEGVPGGAPGRPRGGPVLLLPN